VLKKETIMSKSLRRSFAFPMTAALLVAASGADAATYHVRAGVPNGNGLAWNTAFNNLQSAINAAAPGDTIYIGAGVYLPTVRREASTERSKTFALRGGVKYLGGFPAAGGTLAQRNPSANLTILSGDLSQNDGANFANNGDNAYHVVYLTNAQAGTIVDGMIIQAGNANFSASGFDYERGGGVSADGLMTGTPVFRGCTIRANHAADRGGGLDGSRLSLVQCTIIGNRTGALGEGGGANVSDARYVNCKFLGNVALRGAGLKQGSGSLDLVNCFFSGNVALAASSADVGLGGGAMVVGDNNLTITNCTFANNRATALLGVDQVDSQGGGIWMSSSALLPKIYNTIFWGNSRQTVGVSLTTVTDQAAQIYRSGNVPNATGWNIIQSLTNATGTSNISTNPGLVDVDGPDNLIGTIDDSPQVGPTSPAIDSGNVTVVPNDVLDVDGDANTVELIPLDLLGLNRFADIPTVANTGVGPAWIDRGASEVQLACYANCDGSTGAPILNVNDFVCFNNLYAAGSPNANCDGSTVAPVLNVNDFVCFQNKYAAGCP
jgi:hypothetical protein